MQVCTACELPFFKTDETQTSCIPCAKIDADEPLGALDEAHMQLAQELQDKLTQAPEAPKDVVALQKKLDKALKKIQNLQKKLKTKPASEPHKLTPQLVLKMLTLCHPDKHQNSEDATSVTQTLLEIRRGLDKK